MKSQASPLVKTDRGRFVSISRIRSADTDRDPRNGREVRGERSARHRHDIGPAAPERRPVGVHAAAYDYLAKDGDGVLIQIEAFFRRCVEAGQADGTITRSQTAADLARHLLGVLMGVRVLARVRPERALLEGVVGPAFALLDSSGNGKKRPPGGKRDLAAIQAAFNQWSGESGRDLTAISRVLAMSIDGGAHNLATSRRG
jgi:hypothetical protein